MNHSVLGREKGHIRTLLSLISLVKGFFSLVLQVPVHFKNEFCHPASGQWAGHAEAFQLLTSSPLSEHCHSQDSPSFWFSVLSISCVTQAVPFLPMAEG